MNKFEIVNLEGLGIKAEVIDDGAVYLEYEGFANAAGHPDAVANSSFSLKGKFDRSDELTEEIVDVLARGKHENGTELIYVIKAKSGEKFLIGERGLKITNFPDIEYDDLIKNIEGFIHELRLRAYREGYKQGRLDEKIKGSGSEQYQQQRRDEIVERAKRDVAELVEDMPMSCIYNFVDFVVNRDKRTVVALLRIFKQGEVHARGIAKCHPDDCFNADIGRAIALRRALSLEVPDEYLNAPQPTEVRVGDVIHYQTGESYTVTENISLDMDKIAASTVAKFQENFKIIDDSREEVTE
ncbi:hypothetical protein Q8A72_07080 [Aeribacillus pallidus]|nr:hypothetical protein [Aeribacillus pallidus]